MATRAGQDDLGMSAIQFQPPRTDLLDESFTIERFRELSIDWEHVISGRVLEKQGLGGYGRSFATGASIRYFWTYFAALWGLEAEESFDAAAEKKEQFFEKTAWKKPVIDADPAKPPSYADVPDSWALKHPIAAGKAFLLETTAEKPIIEDDFKNFAAFLTMLQDKVVAVTIVPTGAPPDVTKFLSGVEEFDFAPALIMREYKELTGLKDATDALSVQANKAVGVGADSTDGFQNEGILLRAEQIDALIDGVVRMKAPKVEVDLGLANLAYKASQLGFVLALKEDVALKLEKGNLYKRIDSKVTYVTRYESGGLADLVKALVIPPLAIPLRGILPTLYDDEEELKQMFSSGQNLVQARFFGWNPIKDIINAVTAPIQILLNPGQALRDPIGTAISLAGGPAMALLRQLTKSPDGTVVGVTAPAYYVPVPVDLDPWFEKEKELEADGLKSFRFTRVGSAYRCETGESLWEIMIRCDRDEQFRRETAVWIPQYERTPTRGETLTRYIIYKRPHLGIRSVRLPRLFVREILAYHTGWRAAEIGELVETINLAPLEERTITIERRSSRRREETRSASSIYDRTDTDLSEFTNEIEKEITKSSETSVGANVQGSFGGFGGGVDAKSSSTKFARDMERNAKKAARSMTRNVRQETRVSTTTVEEASQADITGAKIRNINEGRTLNLSLFRVYNRYAADTRLQNLEFVVEPGIEIIAGSELTLPRTVPVNEARWALSALDPNVLPITITKPVDHFLYPHIYAVYWDYVLDQLRKLVGEYFGKDQPLGDPAGDPFFDTGRKQEPIKTDEITESYHQVQARLEAIGETLSVRLSDRNPGDQPVWPHEIRVPSSGFYMDSTVGTFPATENYSEDMRELQIGLKAAEVKKQDALARYYDRLDGDLPGPAWTARVNDRVLTVDLPPGSSKGSWALYVGGEPIRLAMLKQGARMLKYELPEEFDDGASLAVSGPGLPLRPLMLSHA